MADLAGSLGDLGVLLPITIALIVTNHLNATAVLAVVGLLYIFSGLYFHLPIPVQPLKATAAIALATGATAASISAAAIVMGGILLVLVLSGAGKLIARCFDKPVVRGIQLSLGIIILQTGWKKVMDPILFAGSEAHFFSAGSFSLPAGIVLASIAALILIILYRPRQIPASMAVLAFGVLAGALFGSLGNLRDISWGPSYAFSLPGGDDFRFALFVLVLPQIPLTFGNSIVATADVAHRYFGPGAKRVKPTHLCSSLGIANMLGGLVGGMPMCHGSGGLTAHYRFGARSGGATIMLGATLLFLAFLLGKSATIIFGLIPVPVLGLMLLFIGAQHAWLISDLWKQKGGLILALSVAITSSVTGSLIWGLALGLAFSAFKTLVSKLPQQWKARLTRFRT